jgi:hypothetical protein
MSRKKSKVVKKMRARLCMWIFFCTFAADYGETGIDHSAGRVYARVAARVLCALLVRYRGVAAGT